jgi:hypothetical protein
MTGSRITGNSGEVFLTWHGGTRTLATGEEFRVENQSLDPTSTSRWASTPHGRLLAHSGTGDPVLWIRGIHTNGNAGGYVLLPDQRFLLFPVRGTVPLNAVMTAITESGSTMLWFRRSATGLTEVVVSPECDLNAEVLCVIESTGRWLYSYFRNPAGEG